MPLNTPYSPGDTIKSENTNEDLDGLSTGANDADRNSLDLFRDELMPDFFAFGCKWSISSGLTGTMSDGAVYIGGSRIKVSSIGSYDFTDNMDTYVDIGDDAVVDFNTVSNGADAPVLEPNHARNGRIVCKDGSIQLIAQASGDSRNNEIYPVSPFNTKPRSFVSQNANIGDGEVFWSGSSGSLSLNGSFLQAKYHKVGNVIYGYVEFQGNGDAQYPSGSFNFHLPFANDLNNPLIVGGMWLQTKSGTSTARFAGDMRIGGSGKNALVHHFRRDGNNDIRRENTRIANRPNDIDWSGDEEITVNFYYYAKNPSN